MKLLRVIATIDPKSGGPIEGLKNASRVMSELGHTVEIACLDEAGAAEERARLPWKIHCLGPTRLGVYGYSPKLRHWLNARAADYDAVIIHGMWQYHGFATSRACRRRKVPYFIYPHGMLDPWFNQAYPKKKLKKRLYWRWGEHPVLRHAEAVLFTSEEECRLARESFRPYRVKEKVIGYGTSAPEMDPPAVAARFHAESEAPWARRPYWLFLGRIQEKKGLDLLLAAYGRLRRTHPDPPDLVIAGPLQQPDYAARLRETYPQNGVNWIGPLSRDAKWPVLAAAEALVLISHQENFGLVVAEALAVGTPVLISDQVNIWREIVDGGAGFARPDTEAGADALLADWMACDAARKEALRTAAREVFATHFEIRRATGRLIDFIQSTLPRARIRKK